MFDYINIGYFFSLFKYGFILNLPTLIVQYF